MIDIQYIRDNPELVAEKSKQKGYTVDIPLLLAVDANRRTHQATADALRRQKKEQAEAFKENKPTAEQIASGREVKQKLAEIEAELSELEQEYLTLLKSIPNMPLDYVPVGVTEDENEILKTMGELPTFGFEPKNHWEIGQQRDWIDKERAAKVAGSRFAYIKGDLARLHFALVSYGMDILTNEAKIKEIAENAGLNVPTKPFTLVMPPALAKTHVYEATGRLNKEEQTYNLADDDLWLNASAEHVLAPMYLGEILDESALPIRLIGYTTAFRREAGTYGKDTEGILRMHQFDKLEMISFTTAEAGLDEHKLMVAIQEYLMTQLHIPYRVLQKCTADIGGPNAAGIDIDSWLPGQNRYRETHTADYLTDYQARRMQTRVRRIKSGKAELVHNNDATVFSQRPLIAIIENNQQADGTVTIPEVLRPYMGGREKI